MCWVAPFYTTKSVKQEGATIKKKVIEPLFIWRSAKPRCFKNVKNRERLHGIYYYANQKELMTTEIMTSVLAEINGKMEAAKRKIILFMDTAPCHPESLNDRFSNVKVVFLYYVKAPTIRRGYY